jgi:hypothetical protein
MGKLSRDKGKRFERKVATAFRKIYGDTVRRGWQAAKLAPGVKPPDVDGTPFHIECKVGQQPNARNALMQAEDDCGDSGRIPIAVIQFDHEEPFVVLRFEQFLDLIALGGVIGQEPGVEEESH